MGRRRKRVVPSYAFSIHEPTGGKEERCTQLYPSIQGHTQRWERGCAKVPVVLNLLFVIDSQPYGLLRSCGIFLSCHFLHCFVIHPASVVLLLCFALLPVPLCAICSSACQGWVPVCFLPPRFFLPLFCLLVVCSLACSLPSLFFLLFLRCLLWLAVLVPSLLPFPPLMCVKPQTKQNLASHLGFDLSWPKFGLLRYRFHRFCWTFLSDETETIQPLRTDCKIGSFTASSRRIFQNYGILSWSSVTESKNRCTYQTFLPLS